MAAIGQKVQHAGLVYNLAEDSFLTERQALYALQRLWELAGGREDWRGDVCIEIPAATRQQVDWLFAKGAPSVEQRAVSSLIDDGEDQQFTFSTLPMVLPAEVPVWSSERVFPIDLVAFTFLMLSRWEEYHGLISLDHHARGVRTEMLVARLGCEQRPIVDQWALVLRAWLQAVSTDAVGPLPVPSVRMTHDVDRPIRFTKLWRVLRGCAGEILSRSHSPALAFRELSSGLRALGNYRRDPFYQELCRFMQWSEGLGLRGCFYWMTSDPAAYDEGYDALQDPYRAIIAEVRQRGHEVGWHPGYRTSIDQEVFQRELQRIQQVLGESEFGGRQHYLRWRAGESWEAWEDAGLTYDSSLGFADTIGFRCGTCRPFPVYSLQREQQLRLIERPLAAMDCALEIAYPDPEVAKQEMSKLLEAVAEVGGEAVLLMHNSFTNRPLLDAMTRGVEECRCLLSAARPLC